MITFIKLKNGTAVDYPIVDTNLKSIIGLSDSEEITDEVLNQHGYARFVFEDYPKLAEPNSMIHYRINNYKKNEDGSYTYNFEPHFNFIDLYDNNGILIKTKEQQIEENECQKVREQRNKLLSDMDWYAVKKIMNGDDIPLEVVEYCQKLREVPQQEGFPWQTTIPMLPPIINNIK